MKEMEGAKENLDHNFAYLFLLLSRDARSKERIESRRESTRRKKNYTLAIKSIEGHSTTQGEVCCGVSTTLLRHVQGALFLVAAWLCSGARMASDVSSAIGGRSTQIVEKGVGCGENVAGAVGINLEWCGNTRNRGEIFVN